MMHCTCRGEGVCAVCDGVPAGPCPEWARQIGWRARDTSLCEQLVPVTGTLLQLRFCDAPAAPMEVDGQPRALCPVHQMLYVVEAAA
jgi:hypothetical protein